MTKLQIDAAVVQQVREDAKFLRWYAASMTYNDTTAEGGAKHRLHEIAMRIESGYYNRAALQQPEQQAQAGEPPVVFWSGGEPLITPQSHREAIAKKDETEQALKACVEALEIAANFCGKHTAEECPDLVALPINAAITKGQGVMKP